MHRTIAAALAACRCSDRGATAVEYALLAGVIVISIVASVAALGSYPNGVFEGFTDELQSRAP